jgi:spermidine synthase
MQGKIGRGKHFMIPAIIFFCFLLSGLSSLIYEVLWVRMLILVFGSTTFAISTVLTAFMGGLALGSYLFGRTIDRSKRPVRLYGALEVLIGGYALLVPVLFSGLVPVYRWVWQNFHLNFYLFSLMQFILVSAVLIVPTVLMGATLPILGKYYSARQDRLGLTLGGLYAVNTLGGILGAFFSGFFLLPAFGVRTTIFLAAALNLLIGLIVLLAARKGGVGEKAAPASEILLIPPSPPSEKLSSGTLGIVLLAFALSGFASLVYEITWSRVLAMILDSSTYAFTIMLVTFLTGIALGSFFMSRVVDRLTRPLLAFILLESAVGASAFAGLFLFPELPYLFVLFYRSFSGSLPLIFLAKLLLAAGVMILPTFLIGALFPLVVKMYTTNLNRVGQSIGKVYSLNTIGCILGSFGGGFIFVPLMGIRNSLLLAVGLNLFLAFLVLLASPYRIKRVKIPLSASLAGGMLLMAFWVPSWNPSLMSSGVYMYVRYVLELDRRQLLDRYGKEADPLLFYKEGYSSTVSVHKSQASENVYLKVNGKVEASTVGDMPTQILLGQIPMLLSSSRDDVLVIGLGSGVTVGAVGTHPARKITVAELEPAVVEANGHFAHVNHRILEDPRVEVMTYDARNFLLVTPDRFDVIISEPSNPWMAGVSNLFTREFFLLGSQRLKPKGLFCQWLQLYKISPDNLRSILSTFHQVFPHLLVFQVDNYDLIILGSLEPLLMDMKRLGERISQPRVKEDLNRIHIQSIGFFQTHFVLGAGEVPAFVQEALINTDNNALLEFSAPKTLYEDTSETNFQELSKHSRGPDSYVIQGPGQKRVPGK